MENSTPKQVNQPENEELSSKNVTVMKSEEEGEKESFSTVKDEKSSDSDANSEDLSSNEEQNNLNSNSNSQFYESSDSKIDFAVKIDDSDTLSDIEDIKTDTASADSEDSALGSLPPDSALNDREEEVQDRSDGSDSGIGSETNEDAKLPTFNLSLPCTSDTNDSKSNITEPAETSLAVSNTNDESHDPALQQKLKPLKSSLKRKLKDDEIENIEPKPKKRKESIKFDNVTVYYFPRAQGFTCVPSQGGSTLGMEWEHTHMQNFTLAEHALEQRRLHRQILQQLKSERHSLQGISLSSSEDSDTEEEASDISESELDLDSYYFLQPIPTRQRRALLRAAGVRKIEGYEKDECRDIRTSREFCGCACKGACNPETCSCSIAGIKCQVDRLNFPCGCTRDGCCNTTGRIEFNPVRVRTHFIHTLMRLGLEKKNEENQEAVKRQWAEAHSSTTSMCVVNTPYERSRSQTHEDGLLRDVSLSPRVEVESCVNAGNFNNIHCDMNNASGHNNMRKDLAYGYRNDTTNVRNINDLHFENSSNHHNQVPPYPSNILQVKGPPYSVANPMGYDAMANNIQRFPCDLNYTYEQHSDNHHFKGLQSYSATSFEEFAHNSQINMLSHYGHMYVPDAYMHKANPHMNEHNTLQYHNHNISQNQYEVYKNTPDCVNSERKNDTQYTTLMTMPYQNSNKLQSVESDENWFSHEHGHGHEHAHVHDGQLGAEHADPGTQDAADAPAAPGAQPEPNTSETTENFGELIKKTMVESVTV